MSSQKSSTRGFSAESIINIFSLTPDYPAHITINGQDGSDTVNVSAAVNPVMDKSLTVYADTIKVSGSSVISTSGAGSVTLKADRNRGQGGQGSEYKPP